MHLFFTIKYKKFFLIWFKVQGPQHCLNGSRDLPFCTLPRIHPGSWRVVDGCGSQSPAEQRAGCLSCTPDRGTAWGWGPVPGPGPRCRASLPRSETPVPLQNEETFRVVQRSNTSNHFSWLSPTLNSFKLSSEVCFWFVGPSLRLKHESAAHHFRLFQGFSMSVNFSCKNAEIEISWCHHNQSLFFRRVRVKIPPF